MTSEEYHLDLLDIFACSLERLCGSELCCLEHRRKVSALCLLYEIYYRVDHPKNNNLKQFVATRNAQASGALDELALAIPCCYKTHEFSRSFVPAAERLWNLLPSGVVSGDKLGSFKSAVNLRLVRA